MRKSVVLKFTLIGKAKVALTRNNNVVKQRTIQNNSRFLQVFGEHSIRLTGLDVARRMIVDCNYCRSSKRKRLAKNNLWVGHCTRSDHLD